MTDQPKLPATKTPQLVATGDISAIVPRNADEAYRLAQVIVSAKLAPDSYKNDPKQIMLGIMKSLEVGLPPLTGLNNIAIINGRPCIWGDGAVALVQASGYIASYKVETIGSPVEGLQLEKWPDDHGKRVTITRKGHGEGVYVGEFTVGQARRAKLWLSQKRLPWQQYPDRMLENRARAFALRDGFADCLAGLSIREEVEDIPTKTEAAEVKFLDEGLEEPEAAAEPAGEPEDTAAPEPQDAEIVAEEAPEPPEDDFDYLGHFKTTIATLPTKKDAQNFWDASEQGRRQRSEEEQREMARVYADRYGELPE